MDCSCFWLPEYMVFHRVSADFIQYPVHCASWHTIPLYSFTIISSVPARLLLQFQAFNIGFIHAQPRKRKAVLPSASERNCMAGFAKTKHVFELTPNSGFRFCFFQILFEFGNIDFRSMPRRSLLF